MTALRKLYDAELQAVSGGTVYAQYEPHGSGGSMVCPSGYTISTNSYWSATNNSTWTNYNSYTCTPGSGPNGEWWNYANEWQGLFYYNPGS